MIYSYLVILVAVMALFPYLAFVDKRSSLAKYGALISLMGVFNSLCVYVVIPDVFQEGGFILDSGLSLEHAIRESWWHLLLVSSIVLGLSIMRLVQQPRLETE